MAAFPVPRYLAETASREDGLREWIAGLPEVVAGLAVRWSLSVGEPFQPGGQCSWTAPATGPDGAELVLKVGFRFGGGEERDEAAGLRIWEGKGAVRLHAACESESMYALLIERCLPGTPLGQVLPEPSRTWWWPGCCAGYGRNRMISGRGPTPRASRSVDAGASPPA
jgi:streptomycin 6-kinase